MRKKKQARKISKTSKRSAPKKTVNKKPVAKRTTGKKSLSEFRFLKKPKNENERHPRFIYKKKDNKFTGLFVTHDKNDSNRSKVRRLEKNPNPKDERPAKISKKSETRNVTDYGPRLSGWRFHTKKDKETVNAIIKENNQKEHEKRKGG